MICEDPEDNIPEDKQVWSNITDRGIAAVICPDAYFLPGMVTYWIDREKIQGSQDVLRILFKYRGVVSKRSNGAHIPNAVQVPSGVFRLWKKYFGLNDVTEDWFTVMLQDNDPFVIQESTELINVGVVMCADTDHLNKDGEIIHPESAIVLLGLRHKEPEPYRED